MTSVMDLKHILCQPMEEDQYVTDTAWKAQLQQHYTPLNHDYPPHYKNHGPHLDNDYWKYARSTSMGHLNNRSSISSSLIGRSNSMGGSGVHPYLTSSRKRVHSEQQYRISPILSRGYHKQHRHTATQHCPDEVLIAPLTSMSVSMDPTRSSSSSSSSSSSLLSVSPSLSSSISPSSSSSSVSSSSSSSPITPTTPAYHYCRLVPSSSNSHYPSSAPPPPRQRKHSTTHDFSSVNNQIQTRTPWTPAEDILLQKGYEQGLSWAMISTIHLPHRSRGCCWGRFKTLQSKNLIHVKVQQPPSRLARRAWKAMGFNKKPCPPDWASSPLSPSSA